MPDTSLQPRKRKNSQVSRQFNGMINNVKCSCVEHHSKEMLNEVYNVSVNFLWESIFGPTQFCYEYWKSRKFYDFTIGNWEPGTDYLIGRTLEFYVDLGAIGKPKNVEKQKILEYKSNSCIVMTSDSQTHGIIYADYFQAQNKFCFTRVSENKTRLLVTSQLKFLKRPNFLAKSIIDLNAMGALRDSYIYLGIEIPKLTQPQNFPNDITAVDGSSGVLDKTISKINSEQNNELVEEENENKALAEIKRLQKRTIKKRLSSERISISSTYSEYLDSIQDKEVISSEVSYPSLYIRQTSNRGQEMQKEQEYEKIKNFTNAENSCEKALTTAVQTFNFLCFKINVDTLVRVFIIAMLCLMFINGMLYYKLLRIETIAHHVLKNCKNLSNKATPKTV